MSKTCNLAVSYLNHKMLLFVGKISEHLEINNHICG